MSRSSRKRALGLRGILLLVVASCLMIAAACTGAAFLANPGPAATSDAGRDMAGNRVELDPGAPSAEASRADPDIDERFSVPSVGLDVPLGALDAVDGVIVPPGFTSAYAVRNRGVPLADAATGTVYVVMHSVRGGGVAPGNFLIDVDEGRSALSAGAEITVGSHSYRVTGSSIVGKGELASTGSLWESVPGRLVVITCLQKPDGSPSVDNAVITATLG